MDNSINDPNDGPGNGALIGAAVNFNRAIEALNVETLDAEYGPHEAAIDELQVNINNPVTFGICLMHWLNDPVASDPNHFTTEEKAWWLKVAETIGPDHIGKFRRIGKFMAEVDNA